MQESQKIHLPRLMLKILFFLILLNLICVAITYIPVGRLTLYNSIFPGRPRFPFGENPSESFNLTINNLDAMVSSHEISGKPKDPDHFRVVLLGDSSIWGFLQKQEDTLAGILKADPELSCGSRTVEIFNFGYPSLSILKDLFFLEKARAFDPDLILWFTTLESLNRGDQLSTPLVANNPIELTRIINHYDLNIQPQKTSFWDRTLFKQRRNFADMVRLQLYGVMWAATGIDQEFPETYTPALRNFENDNTYKEYTDQIINESDLTLEIIQKSIEKNPSMDFILINEPILIASGENSDVRYNYYYPRWAYDDYREIINSFSSRKQIKFYDFWNLVSEKNFTNSAIHLDKVGENLLAAEVKNIIEEHCEP